MNHDIDQSRIDANWRAISIELDAPRPARVERVLRRLGIPSHVTRLVVATPALRRAWYLALAGAMFIGLAATDATAPRQSVLVLLTLAPLVPVFGVALAYGPSADPAHEMQVATPIRGLRLVAIRTAVVLAVSAAVMTTIALLNDVARPFAAAWLLPGLAVTCASLMLMTFMAPRRASVTACAAWVVVVFVVETAGEPLTTFTAVGQVTAAAVAVVSVALSVVRRSSFDHVVYAS